MAYDRFINIGNRVPTQAELLKICQNYLSGAGEVNIDESGCILLILRGKPVPVFEGIEKAYVIAPVYTSRWVEVRFTKDSLNVLTRHQDEYVNAVADGLEKVFGRLYGKKPSV